MAVAAGTGLRNERLGTGFAAIAALYSKSNPLNRILLPSFAVPHVERRGPAAPEFATTVKSTSAYMNEILILSVVVVMREYRIGRSIVRSVEI